MTLAPSEQHWILLRLLFCPPPCLPSPLSIALPTKALPLQPLPGGVQNLLYTHLEKATGLALQADVLLNGPKKQMQKSLQNGESSSVPQRWAAWPRLSASREGCGQGVTCPGALHLVTGSLCQRQHRELHSCRLMYPADSRRSAAGTPCQSTVHVKGAPAPG